MKSKPVLEIQKYSTHPKEDMVSDVTTPKVLLTQPKLKEFKTLPNNGTPIPGSWCIWTRGTKQADEQVFSFPIQNRFLISFCLFNISFTFNRGPTYRGEIIRGMN